MDSIKDQQADWVRHRQRLEQESRVLVVDGEQSTQRQLEELLFRSHIPARVVSTTKQALALVGREHYSVMVVADVLPGMRGLALTRQVRVSYPDVDVLLTTWEPTVELLSQAFDLRLLDVLVKPFSDGALLAERLKGAVRLHVDRRMRLHVLNQLRTALELLAPDARLRTIAALEHRLSAFKSAIGSSDRVLVVEADSELRTLSESLLLAGLSVETTERLEQAVQRVGEGDVLLLVVGSPVDDAQVLELLRQLRAIDPHIELALVSTTPTVEQGLMALREGVAAYLPWPLPSSMSSVALRMRDILRRGRQARLVDNLFVELYRESARAIGQGEADEDADFGGFRRLIGLDRIATLPRDAEGAPADTSSPEQVEAIQQLDQVLSEILDDLDERSIALRPAAPQTGRGAERRVHTRVVDNQFVRFRHHGATAATLAYLGDLSEGGVFIRTAELPHLGDVLEVDINAEYQGGRYLICCKAEVAWLARDERASPMAPGFGVRFVDPPEDVRGLLSQMVIARRGEEGS